MTALADLISVAGRRHLEDLADGHRRERELAKLDRLMRQRGGLAAAPEPRRSIVGARVQARR